MASSPTVFGLPGRFYVYLLCIWGIVTCALQCTVDRPPKFNFMMGFVIGTHLSMLVALKSNKRGLLFASRVLAMCYTLAYLLALVIFPILLAITVSRGELYTANIEKFHGDRYSTEENANFAFWIALASEFLILGAAILEYKRFKVLNHAWKESFMMDESCAKFEKLPL